MSPSLSSLSVLGLILCRSCAGCVHAGTATEFVCTVALSCLVIFAVVIHHVGSYSSPAFSPAVTPKTGQEGYDTDSPLRAEHDSLIFHTCEHL